MIEKSRSIFQLKYLEEKSTVLHGVAIIAASYDDAKEIFENSGIPYVRIASISEIAKSFLTNEKRLECIDTTEPGQGAE